MSSSEHCRRGIFQIYNVQNLKITGIKTFRICNLVYQAGSRWDTKCVFNFLRFFERTLYKSNYTIFILSWCGTHTKIRSKLFDIITAGSQKITLWGPQRTPLGILRVRVQPGLTLQICPHFEPIGYLYLCCMCFWEHTAIIGLFYVTLIHNLIPYYLNICPIICLL